MDKVKRFDKDNVIKIRKLLDQQLKQLQEYGIGSSLGNITYDSNSFTVKLTVSILSDGGEIKPDYVINWESGDWRKHGLQKHHLGQSFKFRGEWHKIVGCKSRRCKQGVIGQSMDNGKLYAFSVTQLDELAF